MSRDGGWRSRAQLAGEPKRAAAADCRLAAITAALCRRAVAQRMRLTALRIELRIYGMRVTGHRMRIYRLCIGVMASPDRCAV